MGQSMDRLIPRTHRSQIAWEVEPPMSRGLRSYLARPFLASCFFPMGWLVSVPLSKALHAQTSGSAGPHHHTIISAPFKRCPGLTAQLPSLQVDSHRQKEPQTAGSHLSCGPHCPVRLCFWQRCHWGGSPCVGVGWGPRAEEDRLLHITLLSPALSLCLLCKCPGLL